MKYKSYSSRPSNRARTAHFGGRRSNRPGSSYINPAKFVNRAISIQQDKPYQPQHIFDDFKLSPSLQANIAAKGFSIPSPIQDQTIEPILEGRDVVGLANTGTGKTAAFVIPLIERVQYTQDKPGALIMAPTRELALQIDDEFKTFAKNMRLYSAVCVGGMSITHQIRQLQRQPHVIIGTPGRLKDLLKQGALKLNKIEILVLDEADRMLDMGFLPDIRQIVSLTSPNRQSLCFSATTTPTVKNLIDGFLKEPLSVSVVKNQTHDHIDQNVVEASSKEEKLSLLTQMLANPEFEKVLIFGETKFGVQRLADTLTKVGHQSEAIHGNKSQPQRQRALNKFKQQEVKILVATDVAARGLDIPNVSHVINFDQPNTYEDYIHRIGRTGRAGQRGQALTFISKR